MHVIISACSPWSCSHLPLTQRGAGCSGSLSLALDLQLRCTPRHTDAMLMEYHTCIYRRGLVIILMLTFIYFQYENACMYNCVYMPVQNPHRLAVPLVLRYHTVYVLRVHYAIKVHVLTPSFALVLHSPRTPCMHIVYANKLLPSCSSYLSMRVHMR